MKLNQTLLRDVRNAYSDCNGTKHERNLNFRANEYCSVSVAVEILERTVVRYNAFRPELLNRLPNGSKVILAREGSVCVYVISPITVDTCVLKDTLKANECHLRTIDFGGQNIPVYRIWWD